MSLLFQSRTLFMENIKINPESANLVLQTFQKINTLKEVINTSHYCQLREIINSGFVLNEMMNNALKDTNVISFKSSLSKITQHIEKTIMDIDHIKAIEENKEIKIILNQLADNIIQLEIKINANK